MDINEEDLRLQQCLLCKKLKRDPNAVYTSNDEMVCADCCEWHRERQEVIE
jgi:hypothetical protein